MDYIIEGHSFEDEVLSLMQLFYPNKNYVLKDSIGEKGLSVVSCIDGKRCFAFFYSDGCKISEYETICKSEDIREIKKNIKLSLYHCFKGVNNIEMPWGILTGIRPAKRIYDMWNEGYSDNQIENFLKNDFLVSQEKVKLAFDVAYAEKKIIENNRPDKIGVYIGIPFCPTRCLYCSFTSYPLSQYKDKVNLYLNALLKEFEFIKQHIHKFNVESIYIGGGTPTSLDENQLEFLLSSVSEYIKKPIEYTVEAGRPDTVTREKLKILKKYGVGRISINPQTINQKTLDLIGRKHSVDDFINAFYMAREEGHDNINTDLILGLPGENVSDVRRTFEKIYELSPESVTVHTLAVKRASRLKETLENYELANFENMQNMLSVSAEYAEKMGMYPYYMYRQKNMLGNFENVGYCKNGFESIYNVQIMEEKQTIIALGAGGSTKTVDPVTNKIERIFNVKSVDDYINRIDEMIERKAGGLK